MTDINFATAEPQQIIESMKHLIEIELDRELKESDPLYIFLRALSAIIIQQRLIIDETGKMNLLAYATGEYLDHIGVLVGCTRLESTYATVTIEIELSTTRNTTTIIPAGTRFTAGDGIYFKLDQEVLIGIGEKIGIGKATCMTSGDEGNGYAINEINELVDPQAFVKSVRNISESAGGTDKEVDEEYRKRIRQAPEKFSNAGSKGAYEFHTKEVSNLISDVCITSPSPGVVKIQPLLIGGELPTQEILNSITEHLNTREIRPLTDKIEVTTPEIIEYDIDLTYFISRDKISEASKIQTEVNQAVQNYVDWQREKLGRDISPLELQYLMRNAGVKRLELSSPTFIATRDFQVAIARNINVVFAGLEDD